MAKNEIAKVEQSTEVMPAFLNKGIARGNESVNSDDLVIPRIELVQSISPCRKKSDPAYIQGVEEGDFFNNVTREIYGKEITVIPVFFKKEYLLWKDRTKGGGFKGAYSNLQEAAAACEVLPDGMDVEIADTPQHFVIVVHPDGRQEEAVLSMAKSKAKVSKQWNSIIRMNEGDRFSRKYKLSSTEDKSDKGAYFNFRVACVGFVSEEQYRRAEKVYEIVSSGKASVNRDSEVTEEVPF
jgi:hypothetical protein